MRATGKERRFSIGPVLSICEVSIGGLFKVSVGYNNALISIFIIIISTLSLINMELFLPIIMLYTFSRIYDIRRDCEDT